MSANSRRATSAARKPRRDSTNNTAASRRPRAEAISQPATNALAASADIAEGNAVRGHALSAGTAATSGTETRPVTYKNRRNERNAVTMHLNVGAGSFSEASRMVATIAAPSRSANVTSPPGLHIAKKSAARRTYWSVVVGVRPRWVVHQRRKWSSRSVSPWVRPEATAASTATTPNERRCAMIGFNDRADRRTE